MNVHSPPPVLRPGCLHAQHGRQPRKLQHLQDRAHGSGDPQSATNARQDPAVLHQDTDACRPKIVDSTQLEREAVVPGTGQRVHALPDMPRPGGIQSPPQPQVHPIAIPLFTDLHASPSTFRNHAVHSGIRQVAAGGSEEDSSPSHEPIHSRGAGSIGG